MLDSLPLWAERILEWKIEKNMLSCWKVERVTGLRLPPDNSLLERLH